MQFSIKMMYVQLNNILETKQNEINFGQFLFKLIP